MLLPRTDSHDPDANDADPRSTSSAPSVSAPTLSFTTTADALASTPLSNTNPCAAYTWLPDTRSTAPPDATTRALAYNAYSPPNTAASSATPPPTSSSTAPSTTTVRPPVITVTRATPDTTSTDRTSRRPDSTSTGAYGEDCEPGRYTSGVDLAATSRESVTVSTDPAGNVPVSTSAPFSASTSHTDSSTGPLSSLPAAPAPRNAPPPITYSTAPFSSDTFCTTIRTPSRAIHGTYSTGLTPSSTTWRSVTSLAPAGTTNTDCTVTPSRTNTLDAVPTAGGSAGAPTGTHASPYPPLPHAHTHTPFFMLADAVPGA
ncbi:hypothetical protein ECC02_006038 [Trypanosoma cruzi]|uniref:Mucin-2 n=1 Tax=Trypanosoma cruzi TaxID=5693 RepID=A0A7J6Y444_TRYCR|nr:hypothetical protein ECC02_006038 [Trypanosoma cruzi]